MSDVVKVNTFSIVIPTVPENYVLLKRCVSSLFKFASPDYEHEIIIVPNNWEGFSTPVNKGLKQAQGDIILILNDDTEFYGTGWEDKVVKEFENQSCGITGHYLSKQHEKYSALWCTFIKPEVFDKIGLLNEEMNLYSQDIYFGWKSLKEGYITTFIDIPVKHYTSSTTSSIAHEDNERLKKESKEIFKKITGIEHD